MKRDQRFVIDAYRVCDRKNKCFIYIPRLHINWDLALKGHANLSALLCSGTTASKRGEGRGERRGEERGREEVLQIRVAGRMLRIRAARSRAGTNHLPSPCRP